MIKIAIRDDDTNFFTSPEDLERVYSALPGFPVSFAVIPIVKDVSTHGACPDTKGNSVPRYVGDNLALCDWLRKNASNGQCDILLHGITHEYKYVDGKRYAEMEWRDSDARLVELIRHWKDQFMKEFNYPVSCFVAPSNKINRQGICAVYQNGLYYSGIIPIHFCRDFTLQNSVNYIHRWIVRFIYKLPYPDVLTYTTHKELNACLFQSYDYLVRMFDYCERINSPMVINVHYWHLRDHPEELDALVRFVKYAIHRGAEPTKLTNCFKK